MRTLGSVRNPLAVVAALGLLMVACSPEGGDGSPGEQDAGEKVVVELWGFNSAQPEVDGWNAMFEPFEDEHPEIDVQYRGIKGTEYDSVLRTAMQSGEGPDMLTLRPFGVEQYQDSLVPLDSDVTALESWPQDVVDVARVPDQSEVFGVPFSMETIQVFYNKELFDELDLSPPTTWEDFVHVSETLKENDITPIGAEIKDGNLIPFYLPVFVATRYGADEFRQQLLSGEATFEDADFVAALKFFKDEIVAKYFPEDAGGLTMPDVRSLFLAGKAGMLVSGFWELTGIEEAGVEVGVFNMPPTPDALIDRPVTAWYLDGAIGVNADSPQQSAAVEVAKYIATEEFGRLMMKENHYVSVVPGVTADDPLMNEQLESYREAGATDIAYSDFNYGNPNGWTLISNELQKYMFDEKSAEEATAAIMRGLRQWWKPSS